MRCLIVILISVLACTGTTAQNACPEISAPKKSKRANEHNSLGIRVAYNNTRATKAYDYVKIASLNRFQIGIFRVQYLSRNLVLKTSLVYNQKGNFHNDDDAIADGGKKVDIKLNYLEASVEGGYVARIRGNHSIQVAIGPYLAYGVSGTEKGFAETLIGRNKVDQKIEFVNTQSAGTITKMKPIDAGLNFSIAYGYKKYAVFMNYELGLTNRENWGEAFNRVASVGVSYSFR
jgi:hypothetical protein